MRDPLGFMRAALAGVILFVAASGAIAQAWCGRNSQAVHGVVRPLCD